MGRCLLMVAAIYATLPTVQSFQVRSKLILKKSDPFRHYSFCNLHRTSVQRTWIAAKITVQLSDRYLQESNGFRRLSAAVNKVQVLQKGPSGSELGVIFEYPDKVLVTDVGSALSSPVQMLVNDGPFDASERELQEPIVLRIPTSVNPIHAEMLEQIYGRSARVERWDPESSSNSTNDNLLCEIYFCEADNSPFTTRWLQEIVERLEPAGTIC